MSTDEYTYVPGPVTSRHASAALFCGIIAIVLLPIVGFFATMKAGHIAFGLMPAIISIPVIVLAHSEHAKIRRSNGALKGSGMAIAGFICGYLSLILIPLLAWDATKYMQARYVSIEKSIRYYAIGTSAACQQYFMKHGTPTAPVADIMHDAGPLGHGMTLVAPKTEFKANGTFTIHHPLVGNITYYVGSGFPTDP